MKTFWLVEEKLYDDEFYIRLYDALDRNNISYKAVDYYCNINGQRDIVDFMIKNHEDYLFMPYGCIQYIDWFKKVVSDCSPNTQINSALFFDLGKLSFPTYSSYWGKYLLNQNVVMTTYGELIRRKSFFYSLFGGDQKAIFVRPASNDKIFTGRLFYEENFDKDVRHMGYSIEQDFPKDMLVVVGEPFNIKNEWRFLIINGEVITSSLYNVNGLNEEKAGCDVVEAVQMAEKVASDPWQPDDIYVLDICETKGNNIYTLEIGSINSAGWYSMDLDKVVCGIEKWKYKYLSEQEL